MELRATCDISGYLVKLFERSPPSFNLALSHSG
jgi:hypothetical protein